MADFGWDYPPGVTGNEPQITGEWPCADCGAILPDEGDCPECGNALVLRESENRAGARWVCEDCGHDGGDEDVCPGGCRKEA